MARMKKKRTREVKKKRSKLRRRQVFHRIFVKNSSQEDTLVRNFHSGHSMSNLI